MADEGMDDPRLVAEGELSLARLALDDGELRHAAEHVANALEVAPTLPEVHAALAGLFTHPGGGAGLWPLAGDVYVGTVVARAHALAYEGQYAEGLGLLVSAQQHEPGKAWADVAWVVDPGMPVKVTPEQLLRVFAKVYGIQPDPCPDELRAAFEPYLRLARNAAAAHPVSVDTLWIASVQVRRFGYLDEAVEYARRAEQVEPSDRAAIALAYALRAQGRTDDAVVALERAIGYAPDNTSIHADLAGLLGAAGRLDEAIGWTERALAIDPEDDCSRIERSSLRYQRDGDTAHLTDLLVQLRAAEPAGHEAQHAEQELTRHSQRAWLGWIPEPTESVINVLKQVLAAGAGQEGGSLTVSAIEPPSALLAFDRAVPGFEVSFDEVLAPDPRESVTIQGRQVLEPIERTAWVYDGTKAKPGFEPPSVPAAQAVAQLARSSWVHLPAAYDDAVLLADVPINDLLGVLVHPPAAPTGDWPSWIRAVQTWACLGIARHGSDPIVGSERYQVLQELVFGPEDWITESALFALVAAAWAEPDARGPIGELVSSRLGAAVEAANHRPVTILESLAALTLALPSVPKSTAGLARDILTEPDAQPEAAKPPKPKRRRLFRRR